MRRRGGFVENAGSGSAGDICKSSTLIQWAEKCVWQIFCVFTKMSLEMWPHFHTNLLIQLTQ